MNTNKHQQSIWSKDGSRREIDYSQFDLNDPDDYAQALALIIQEMEADGQSYSFIAGEDAWNNKNASQRQDIEDVVAGRKTYKDLSFFDWNKPKVKYRFLEHKHRVECIS